MRRCLSLGAVLLVLAGCQGPIMSGGYHQSPYQGYGVGGPGPGVVPDNYQQTSIPAPGMPEAPYAQDMGQLPPRIPQPPILSQVNFLGLESLVIHWDARVPGSFDSEPFICPATHDFAQGHIFRLKLSNIPQHPGKELYPTLEIAPTAARTQAFLAHSSIPIEFTDNDFDQVFSGNFITKVVYLPNPEYQGLAMSGVGTLVNTQLQPGVDPIVEASKRGSILAVIRIGNKDLSGSPRYGVPGYGQQDGYQTVPQNAISGVNVPQYGTPMTKTTTGIPGPPQLPQDNFYMPNRYPVVRAEPIPSPPSQPTYVPQQPGTQPAPMYPQQ
jgi:hypothetical protein